MDGREIKGGKMGDKNGLLVDAQVFNPCLCTITSPWLATLSFGKIETER